MRNWNAHGGWLLGCLLFYGCSSPLSPSNNNSSAGTFKIGAKVRDFREGNATDSSGSTHPQFNQTHWICDAKDSGATVLAALDTNDATDRAFPGDNRGPLLDTSMSASLKRCFEPMDRFSDWYNDRDPSVNRPFLVDLQFDKDDAGMYLFQQLKFFPIDSGGNYKKTKADGPDIFGHLQTGFKDDVDLTKHNYGFTLELHGRFKYEQGKGQYIAVVSDDDLWLFINNKNAIDLGGTHPAQKDTVMLDSLGLSDQTTYPLDLFFAERSVASSTLVIASSVRITPL